MTIRDLVPFWRRTIPIRRDDLEEPFRMFRREFNRLIDEFFRDFELEPFERRLGTFSPSVNVVEDDNEIKISAELPGMDEKDIEVSINKDVLTIRGEKKEEHEDKGRNYYRMERSYGSFSRSIPLPVDVDKDKAKAELKKGVLTITLPKTQQAISETKKIPIQAE